MNAPLVVLTMADSEKSPLSSSHLPIHHHIIAALVLYAEAKKLHIFCIGNANPPKYIMPMTN